MNKQLETVKIGFIPLVDCALLCVAKEKGFAEQEGLDLQLFKEVSWANIRDKVYLGYLNGAQMLAGMPLAANLSLMPNSTEVYAPFVLGRNGNAITVSHSLYEEMVEFEGNFLHERDLNIMGRALKAVIKRRKEEGRPQLRFGMVFPFSSHNYHLRYWMAACDINPDLDVHLAVVPPPLMDQNLAQGYLDGFCVGEPWNSLVVAQDFGVIIAATAQIWSKSPEKLLGLRKNWAQENKETVRKLLRSLEKAAKWVENVDNLKELSVLLSGHTYLDVPAEIIIRALTGELRLKKGEDFIKIDDFLTLAGKGVNCPNYNEASWLIDQMKRWGQIKAGVETGPAIVDAFCQDLYLDALSADNTEGVSKVRLFDIA